MRNQNDAEESPEKKDIVRKRSAHNVRGEEKGDLHIPGSR
jgi:hypothetical protein